jgi:hypothetical protein
MFWWQPEGGHVRIIVVDVMGRTVATLVDAQMPVGYHDVTWSGSRLGSGLYYYRMEVNGFAETKQMTLLK